MANAIYWREKSETQLAAFQQRQVGNTCAAHAIAAAVNLAFNLGLEGKQIGSDAYANWWRGWGNPFHAGIPPYAQINLLKHLAEVKKIPLEPHHYSWDPQRWLEVLRQPNQLLLITLFWLARPAPLTRALEKWKFPRITYNLGDENYTQPNGVIITGHTMLLAAYDPQHITHGGKTRPWGFVNSWIDGGNYLFWMGDEDLRFPRQAVQLIFSEK
jgi:hypothetical protein